MNKHESRCNSIVKIIIFNYLHYYDYFLQVKNHLSLALQKDVWMLCHEMFKKQLLLKAQLVLAFDTKETNTIALLDIQFCRTAVHMFLNASFVIEFIETKMLWYFFLFMILYFLLIEETIDSPLCCSASKSNQRSFKVEKTQIRA